MNFSREDILMPVSGWVPNIDPGKKCVHGVYIPSTQDDQTFAEKCDVCISLIAYLAKTGKTLEEIDSHTKFLWTRLDKKEKEPWTFEQLDKIDALIKEGESK